MTNRDRLVADLAAEIERLWATPGERSDIEAAADRLIALGWTRLDAATDLGQQTVVSTALGRRVTEKPLVLHADQCALAPDHGGPCMWVGGRRPEDPVYPNRRAADLRGIVTDPAWAEGHRRGATLDEERLARALLDPYEGQPADPEYGIGGTCRACGEDTLWMRDARHGAAAIAEAYREDTDAHD